MHTALSKKVMGTENLNKSIIIRSEKHQKGHLHAHSAVTKDNSRSLNTTIPTMDKINEFLKANKRLRDRDFKQIHKNMVWEDLEFMKAVEPAEKIEALCKNLLEENNALISNRPTANIEIQCDPSCEFYAGYGKAKANTIHCPHKSTIDQTL
jgi:hypothetical protein